MKNTTVPGLLSLAVIVGCAGESVSNETSGHFEEFSQEQLQSHAGRLAFVPEYEPGQNVMVSSEIFSLQGHSMLKAIVDAGVRKLYVIPSFRAFARPTDALDSVRRDAERALAERRVQIDASVRADLDDIFAHVQVVARQEPLYVPRGGQVFSTVWTRDWAPLAARTQEGLPRIVDLNYYPERQWDDTVPFSFYSFLKPAHSELERISLPVYNEGGNFMNTPEWCFMTARVSEANSRSQAALTEEDERASNRRVTRDVVMTPSEIVALYNSYGCRQTRIFPRLPDEGTGHIDMWAKLLDARTVMVGDVWDESIATLTPENFARISKGHKSYDSMVRGIRAMQEFLREQQGWFEAQGFRVLKVPMPLNLWVFDEDSFAGRRAIFEARGFSPEEARARAVEASGWFLTRSYTNSLVANRTILSPRYVSGVMVQWNPRTNLERRVPFAYPDGALLGRYEEAVRRAIESAGFSVRFIETDELISIGGSVHCTTMQTPL